MGVGILGCRDSGCRDFGIDPIFSPLRDETSFSLARFRSVFRKILQLIENTDLTRVEPGAGRLHLRLQIHGILLSSSEGE